MWTLEFLLIAGLWVSTVVHLRKVRFHTLRYSRRLSLDLMSGVGLLWAGFYVLLASPYPIEDAAHLAPFIQLLTMAVFAIMASTIKRLDELDRQALELQEQIDG